MSSFGKTYHVTGWKVGYVAAPAALIAEFRKVHQFNVFTVNTPMQLGLAEYMQDPAPYLDLPAFYQKKRDFFRAGLANSRFKLLPCTGTYFQCVDYSAISDLPEAEFAQVADERDRRRGNSGVGVLSRAARIGRGALLLCQARRNARHRARTAGAPVHDPRDAATRTYVPRQRAQRPMRCVAHVAPVPGARFPLRWRDVRHIRLAVFGHPLRRRAHIDRVHIAFPVDARIEQEVMPVNLLRCKSD